MTALRHDAASYRDEHDFVAQYAPFLVDGVEAGEAVIVVTTTSNRAALRAALGSRAGNVDLIAAESWFGKPAQTIRAYNELFSAALREGRGGIRVLGEVQFGSSAAEHQRWVRYESLLNHAFADLPAWIVCPYRTDRWPEAVSCSAEHTHTHWFAGGERTPSHDYVAPHDMESIPLDVPDRPATVDIELPTALRQVRELVRRAAGATGRTPAAVDDLLVVCSELVANVERHAGGAGRFRLWIEPDGSVVGSVDDRGPGFDPLAGYRPPAPTEPGSRGLWLARQICTDVLIADRDPAGARVTFEI